MSRLTKKQIEFIEHLYSYGDSDDELDAGIEGLIGDPDMVSITIHWEAEPALSIPLLAKKGYLEIDEDTHEILFNSWKNICEDLDVDAKTEFESFDEFQEKFTQSYYG